MHMTHIGQLHMPANLVRRPAQPLAYVYSPPSYADACNPCTQMPAPPVDVCTLLTQMSLTPCSLFLFSPITIALMVDSVRLCMSLRYTYISLVLRRVKKSFSAFKLQVKTQTIVVGNEHLHSRTQWAKCFPPLDVKECILMLALIMECRYMECRCSSLETNIFLHALRNAELSLSPRRLLHRYSLNC